MVRVLGTHHTKHRLLPILSEKMGMKWGGGRSIDLATLWRHLFVGPSLAFHSNSGARSDRTRLPSHQQYCDLPRYRTVQVQSQLWGGHWLSPLIKSCRKRKCRVSYLSLFNHLIFHATHFSTVGWKMGMIFCHRSKEYAMQILKRHRKRKFHKL